MDIRGKLNIGNQAHPAARRHFTVRLLESQPQMGRIDLLAHLLGQFGEKLPNYVVRREAVDILALRNTSHE